MRKFLILTVFTLKLLVANSQVDSVKSIITTKAIGHFLITTHDSVDVFVKVDKVKYFDKKKFDFDGADVSIRIEDNNGKVCFLKNLSTTHNALNDINSIDLPGIGKALILVYDQFPCYGKMCRSFQIFGFNELGYFVPFTGIIDLGNGGNAELVCNFKLKWMDIHGNEVSASKNASFDPSYFPADDQLYIEVPTDFILFQVKSLNYFPIYIGGLWYDKAYVQNTFGRSPIFYNNSNIIVIDNMDNERFKEPKILYNTPNTLGDYKLVNFKLNTTVKLIDMIVDSETWIHLEIDGVEGYMTYSDFSMSGFELSD